MRHNLFITYASLPLLGLLLATNPATSAEPAAAGTPAPAAVSTPAAAPTDATGSSTPTPQPASSKPAPPPRSAERHGRTSLDVRLEVGDLVGQRTLLNASLASAILSNRKADVSAATSALERNTSELGTVVGSAWSESDRKSFADNWTAESKAVEDYANALLHKDTAAQERAAASWQSAIAQRASQWAARSGSTTSPLTMLQEQAAAERAVLDNEAVGEIANQYSALQKSYEHSQPVAEFLASALIRGGSGEMRQLEDSPAATQRLKLHALFIEHAFLLSNMTGDYLAGRTDEYTAVSAILDMNSDRLISQMNTAFGQEAGNEFSKLWKTHIEHVMDYTKAKEPPDKTVQKRAINDLAQYAESLTELLHPMPKPATPMHTKKAKKQAKKPKAKEPAQLVDPQTKYVLDVVGVVNAQATHSSGGAFDAMQRLFEHSGGVADAISDAADSRPVSTP